MTPVLHPLARKREVVVVFVSYGNGARLPSWACPTASRRSDAVGCPGCGSVNSSYTRTQTASGR